MNREELWRREARLFARHLIGTRAPTGFIDQYIGAQKSLRWARRHPMSDRLVRAFHRSPHWLPALDAGTALLDRDGLLRRKLLLATALLEARTDTTQHFLPRNEFIAIPLIRVLWHGALGVLWACVGLPLVWILSRRGRRR